WLLSVIAGSAAAVSFAGCALLVPRFGAKGAAVATLLAYGTSALVTYRIAQRVHPLPYRGGKLITVFLIALVLTLAAQRWAAAGASGIAMKVTALAAFAILCARLELWKERGAVAPSYLAAAQATAQPVERGGA